MDVVSEYVPADIGGFAEKKKVWPRGTFAVETAYRSVKVFTA